MSAACGRNHTLALTGKEGPLPSKWGQRPNGPPGAGGGAAPVTHGRDQKDAQGARWAAA